jgi:hypothetical protein
MPTLVYAVARPDLAPLEMPDRFRHEIAYFMALPGGEGVPPLKEREYWVRLEDARRWCEEGVICIVSPLDSEHHTEIELSEEHEAWLDWLIEHQVEHLRLA